MFLLNCSNQTEAEGEKEARRHLKAPSPVGHYPPVGARMDVVVKGGGHVSPASRRVNYGAFLSV